MAAESSPSDIGFVRRTGYSRGPRAKGMRSMDDQTQGTLSDEDIRTILPSATARRRSSCTTTPNDADGTDGDATDGTDGDSSDADGTDGTDADGTDGTDADGTDGDATDGTDGDAGDA